MDTSYDTETGLSHQVTCETPGTVANSYSGALVPVEYVQGLTHAELVELLIPGDDEEETETFRQRVLDSFQSQAFGGNQADYREQVLAMPGVGDVKVHAVWNEGLAPSSLIPDLSLIHISPVAYCRRRRLRRRAGADNHGLSAEV